MCAFGKAKDLVEVEVETIYLVKNPNIQYTVGIDIPKKKKTIL